MTPLYITRTCSDDGKLTVSKNEVRIGSTVKKIEWIESHWPGWASEMKALFGQPWSEVNWLGAAQDGDWMVKIDSKLRQFHQWRYVMDKVLATSINVTITCHKHELRLIIPTRMKGAGGALEKSQGIKNNKLYYAHALAPQGEFMYLLQSSCTSNTHWY